MTKKISVSATVVVPVACIEFMSLILILIVVICSLYHIRFSILSLFESLSWLFHQRCLHSLPQEELIYKEEFSALICGADFTSFSKSKIYIVSGLIHLFVVSGSHLIIVNTFLSFIFKHTIAKNKTNENESFIFSLFRWGLLFSYSLCCKMNAPSIRSLINLILTQITKTLHLKITTDFCLLISGLLCIATKPIWINSLSFQMSWIAGLSLYLTRKHVKSKLTTQLVFYILFLPTFHFLGIPSIFILFTGLIFTPFFEKVIFPIALICYAINLISSKISIFIIPVFNFLIGLMGAILNQFELESTVGTFQNKDFYLITNWILILLVHFILHLIEVRKCQNSYS